jgi:5-methylcytosine-specific restriction endonuclease McrA
MAKSKAQCVCCGHNGSYYPLDREHTKTRGSGGTDDEWNVSIMCRKCHTEKGSKGLSHMANKYPNYKKWLLEMGWNYDEFLKKWVRYE